MDINYFREFVILAETKNYWAASERLFIGQSSLSKHIKTLEKSLGAALFDRTSRKVELTEFGKRMLPYAQSVAKLQYEYEAAAFNYLHEEKEILNIASIPVMAQYDITDILVKFQLDFPTVQINTFESDTLEVREWLLERKCELGFFRDSVAYLEHGPDKDDLGLHHAGAAVMMPPVGEELPGGKKPMGPPSLGDLVSRPPKGVPYVGLEFPMADAPGTDKTKWLAWDGEKAHISGLDDYILNHRRRMKPCTSFDTLGMDSGENQEFGTPEQDYMHFNEYIAPAIASLKEQFPRRVRPLL